MSELLLLEKLKQLEISLQLEEDRLKINAPKGVLTSALIAELKEKKQEIIEFLQNDAAGRDKFESIQPAEKKEYYELSPAQNRLYILQRMQLEGTAYNKPQFIPLEMGVEIKKIEETFRKLIARHENFRTSFYIEKEEPVQRVHGDLPFEIEHHQFAADGLAPAPGFFIRPFDLARAPLLRVGLLEPARYGTGPGNLPAQALLMVDMHHIISDGSSQEILVNDFLALYEGENLPPLRIQYKDFSQWLKREKEKEKIKHQEKFWQEEFAGEIPVLELPTDYPRPLEQSFEGNCVNSRMSREKTRAIKALALKTNSTLFIVLAAVFNILLSKLSGQEDIVIGTPTAGRRYAGLEKIIGMFVNTLSLRNYPAGERTFSEFLGEVTKKTLKAFENQEYPFEDLVDKLAVKRDVGHNPLFDVMLVLQNMNTPWAGREKEEPPHPPREHENIFLAAKFDLTLTAMEIGQGLFFSFEYCTKLFKKETIERYSRYIQNILSIIVKDPGIRINEIDIITGEEKNRLLYEFNETRAEYPGDKTIHCLFKEQEERTPDRIALTAEQLEEGDESSTRPVGLAEPVQLTYRQVNEQSRAMAQLLEEQGVQPGTIVGIMTPRCPGMITGIMGILKAGAAYMPIEPGSPAQRIDYMLTDAGIRVLITANNWDEQDETLKQWQGKKVLIDKTPGTQKHTTPARTFTGEGRDRSAHSPAAPAYVIYTSGSTGLPKGVIIEHRSLVNRLNWMQKKYPINGSDTILQKTTYTFDVSVWEILWWSLVGAKVHLLRPGGEKEPGIITAAVERNRVTVMHFVPSMLAVFLDYIDEHLYAPRLSSLKQVIASGEALTLNQVERFNHVLRRKTGTALANLYGPTEAAIDVTYFDCPGDKKIASIPIGKPIDNIRLYILDKDMQLQPLGVTGELCIAGIGLARGYINRPQLTAEKFHPLTYPSNKSYKTHQPYIPGKGYRTGDLARWLPDGNIEFIGRMDHQVKIRGYRIELGEIESCLLRVTGVKEAAVVIRKDKHENSYLYAYLVTDKQLDIQRVKISLSERLPAYMVPMHFQELEKMPLTPNGKINRKVLTTLEIDRKANTANALPQNETEKKLLEFWSEFLGMEKKHIGLENNFFDYGGNSLGLIMMTSRIHTEFGVEIPITQLYHTPTIRGMAKLIASGKFSESPVVLLSALKQKKIFCFPPQLGYGVYYQEHANAINDYSFYAFSFIEDEDRLTQYADIMENLQPLGPYICFGFSAAGRLTFEVAKALEKRGRQVSDIIFFDCFFTENPTKISDADMEDIHRNLEKTLAAWGVPFLMEKVLEKVNKFIEYNHSRKSLEVINANVHLIVSEEATDDEWLACWDNLTTKPVKIYRALGGHHDLFSKKYFQKNIEIMKKILNQIEM